MRIRTTKFFVREGFGSLKKNKTMSAASITSVIAALLVIGIFYIIMLNVDYAATNLEAQVEMNVYLKDGLSENVINTMISEVKSISGIKDVKFISKAEALKNLQKQWGDNKSLLEGLDGDNPLPDTLVLKLTDPQLASSVSLSISAMSNIERVVYGKDELEKLLKATYILRLTSLMVIIILLFISVFIISNTIKLTVFARRREIGIMKFVGATDWFVRGPFIVEGMILGLIGGLLSTGLLAMGYTYFCNFFKQQMIGFLAVSLMPAKPLLSALIVILTGVGLVIGALGSFLSVRKFIRV